MNEEELLLHYGVKGMKWGVRRARNSVGSVTRKIKDAHDKADASKNARRTASQQRQNNSKFGQAHLKANAKKEARRTASQERQNNSKFGQAHLKANAKKDARREKQNANLAEHKRLEKERADKTVAKVKASKSYKEAQKNKKSEAKRKDTSDKVKNGIDTKLSNKSKLASAAVETALYMSVGALAAKSLGYTPIIGAGLGLGIDYLVADSKEK